MLQFRDAMKFFSVIMLSSINKQVNCEDISPQIFSLPYNLSTQKNGLSTLGLQRGQPVKV